MDELLEHGTVPPCSSEMNSQLDSVLSEGLQSRKTAGRNTPLVAVMAGLSELAHFEQGLCAPSPLDTDADLPSDLKFAVNKIIGSSCDIDKWRGSKCLFLRRS